MDYYTHTCKCGCGGQIEIKGYHKYKGIPLFIQGHNAKGIFHPLYNKHHPEEVKQKIKNSNLGKSRGLGKQKSEEHRKNIAKSKQGIKRKPFSKEWKQNIGKAQQGEKNYFYGVHFFGENHPNWNNGSSFEPYTPEFNKELKDRVKQRDFYTCQTPNCMNVDCLDIHHIDYDKKNNSLENLITLCHSCHAKTNGKNNRVYFTNYYQEILNVYL